MTLDIVRLADRPDLGRSLDEDFDGAWPPFMLWDPMGTVYYGVAHDLYPEFVFAAVDPADPAARSPGRTRCRGAGRSPSFPTAAGTG